MIFVPVLIALVFAIVFAMAVAPMQSRGGRRRRSKSFLSIMLDGQARTEKRNSSHRGVMCGPGGSRRRR